MLYHPILRRSNGQNFNGALQTAISRLFVLLQHMGSQPRVEGRQRILNSLIWANNFVHWVRMKLAIELPLARLSRLQPCRKTNSAHPTRPKPPGSRPRRPRRCQLTGRADATNEIYSRFPSGGATNKSFHISTWHHSLQCKRKANIHNLQKPLACKVLAPVTVLNTSGKDFQPKSPGIRRLTAVRLGKS